jgi:hypothetical protein
MSFDIYFFIFIIYLLICSSIIVRSNGIHFGGKQTSVYKLTSLGMSSVSLRTLLNFSELQKVLGFFWLVGCLFGWLVSCFGWIFWDKVSLCSQGWPSTCNLPASASQMLRLQVWDTMPHLESSVLRIKWDILCKETIPKAIYTKL